MDVPRSQGWRSEIDHSLRQLTQSGLISAQEGGKRVGWGQGIDLRQEKSPLANPLSREVEGMQSCGSHLGLSAGLLLGFSLAFPL